MDKITNMSKKEAKKELDVFTDAFESLMLSTVNDNAEPFISYAPFVEDDQANYYICVSGFVQHSKNMNNNKKASIMFIEDETKAEHPFGRKRLYFSAQTEKFEKDDKRNEAIKELFAKKFGENMSFMFKMPDFRVYKITPKEGSLVLGFGAAYQVSGNKKTLKTKTQLHEQEHDKNLKE